MLPTLGIFSNSKKKTTNLYPGSTVVAGYNVFSLRLPAIATTVSISYAQIELQVRRYTYKDCRVSKVTSMVLADNYGSAIIDKENIKGLVKIPVSDIKKSIITFTGSSISYKENSVEIVNIPYTLRDNNGNKSMYLFMFGELEFKPNYKGYDFIRSMSTHNKYTGEFIKWNLDMDMNQVLESSDDYIPTGVNTYDAARLKERSEQGWLVAKLCKIEVFYIKQPGNQTIKLTTEIDTSVDKYNTVLIGWYPKDDDPNSYTFKCEIDGSQLLPLTNDIIGAIFGYHLYYKITPIVGNDKVSRKVYGKLIDYIT